MCVAQPIGSSVKECCAHDTEQIHCKHGSGALLTVESCVLLVLCLLNECGARWQISERVWNSLVSATLKSQAVGVLLSLSALNSAERVIFMSSGGQGQITSGNPLTFELSTLACDPVRSRKWKIQYELYNSR